MPHIHWVARQNKLEIPKDKDEVNKQDIHDCDGRAHDPDTMVAPLTPKPKRKSEGLNATARSKRSRRGRLMNAEQHAHYVGSKRH